MTTGANALLGEVNKKEQDQLARIEAKKAEKMAAFEAKKAMIAKEAEALEAEAREAELKFEDQENEAILASAQERQTVLQSVANASETMKVAAEKRGAPKAPPRRPRGTSARQLTGRVSRRSRSRRRPSAHFR